MKLIVVRHGQTEYNNNGLIQGLIDLPLNNTGINQALLAANNLKNIKIDIAVVSPLKRAKQTLNIILDTLNLNITPIIDKRFIERDFGSYENLKVDPYIKILNEKNFNLPTVENNEKILNRVKNGIIDLNNKYENKNVLLVCHAHVLKTILLLVDPAKGYDYPLNNGEYKIFNIENNKITLL